MMILIVLGVALLIGLFAVMIKQGNVPDFGGNPEKDDDVELH